MASPPALPTSEWRIGEPDLVIAATQSLAEMPRRPGWQRLAALTAHQTCAYAPAAFLGHFTVFVLACFIGYMVVWNVTPALHTPLMSVTNAISSIIVIGALVQILPPEAGTNGRPDQLIQWLAFAGIVLTAINMFGGFAVTRRMLAMFRK
mgnify:CR=1 FL=1